MPFAVIVDRPSVLRGRRGEPYPGFSGFFRNEVANKNWPLGTQAETDSSELALNFGIAVTGIRRFHNYLVTPQGIDRWVTTSMA